MGIFWFGQADGLGDIKVKDLKAERQKLEVTQKQLGGKMRDAQDRYDGLDHSSREPGLSEADLDDIAYEMERAEIAKKNAENDRQMALNELTTVDLLLDLFKHEERLKKKGVWKIIQTLDADELQGQLGNITASIKAGRDNITDLNAVLGISQDRVVAQRSPAFRRIRDQIASRRSASG